MKWNKLISLLCLSFIVLSFKADKNRIDWQKNRLLTWNDYKAQPDFNDNFRDAVTASALVFKTKCNDTTGELIVIMEAQFIKDQSWVKPIARTPYHLQHEQMHFNIAELFARKFRQAIANRSLHCSDYPEIQALSNQFMDEAHYFQMKYDGATKFSLDEVAQQQWNSSILKQLEDLQKFAH